MNARLAKEDIALLLPTNLSNVADEPRFGSDAPSLAGRIGQLFSWIAELPRRRSVLAELNELSDHELADIGLNRSELPRVFDPEFAARRARGSHVVGHALSI